jgi:hypothetical protein
VQILFTDLLVAAGLLLPTHQSVSLCNTSLLLVAVDLTDIAVTKVAAVVVLAA